MVQISLKRIKNINNFSHAEQKNDDTHFKRKSFSKKSIDESSTHSNASKKNQDKKKRSFEDQSLSQDIDKSYKKARKNDSQTQSFQREVSRSGKRKFQNCSSSDANNSTKDYKNSKKKRVIDYLNQNNPNSLKEIVNKLIYSDENNDICLDVFDDDTKNNKENEFPISSLKNENYINYQHVFENVNVNQQYLKDLEQQTIFPKTYEVYSNKTYRESYGAGDECVEKIRRVLFEFGLKPTFNQITFFESMIRACLKFIYRYDFEQNVDRLMKENNWDEIIQEVLIITARRMGKTTAVAMFVAALMICVPHVTIMVSRFLKSSIFLRH